VFLSRSITNLRGDATGAWVDRRGGHKGLRGKPLPSGGGGIAGRATLVNRIKGRSSRVLRQEFASLRSRLPTLWSRSYYAGSVGAVSDSVVRRYIEAQKGA
jgi:hypothetical protein